MMFGLVSWICIRGPRIGIETGIGIGIGIGTGFTCSRSLCVVVFFLPGNLRTCMPQRERERESRNFIFKGKGEGIFFLSLIQGFKNASGKESNVDKMKGNRHFWMGFFLFFSFFSLSIYPSIGWCTYAW